MQLAPYATTYRPSLRQGVTTCWVVLSHLSCPAMRVRRQRNWDCRGTPWCLRRRRLQQHLCTTQWSRRRWWRPSTVCGATLARWCPVSGSGSRVWTMVVCCACQDGHPGRCEAVCARGVGAWLVGGKLTPITTCSVLRLTCAWHTMQMVEGRVAIEDAIRTMLVAPATPAITHTQCLDTACAGHAADLARTQVRPAVSPHTLLPACQRSSACRSSLSQLPRHRGSDGSSPSDRIRRHGAWAGRFGENVAVCGADVPGGFPADVPQAAGSSSVTVHG